MIRIGQTQVLLFLNRLRDLPDEVRPDIGRAIRDGAGRIADQAKRNASWSTRIPGAIEVHHVVLTRQDAAFITVDEDTAPHARPFEGIAGGGPTFRHPVFGNRGVWVTQDRRPFLVPAVRQHDDRVVDEVDRAIDRHLDRL